MLINHQQTRVHSFEEWQASFWNSPEKIAEKQTKFSYKLYLLLNCGDGENQAIDMSNTLGESLQMLFSLCDYIVAAISNPADQELTDSAERHGKTH